MDIELNGEYVDSIAFSFRKFSYRILGDQREAVNNIINRLYRENQPFVSTSLKTKEEFVKENHCNKIHNEKRMICLDDDDDFRLELLDEVVIIECGRLYNEDCLRDWFKKNNTCPLCMKVIAFKN
ncbi:hypothetical protein FACS189472_10090 [Alphaproteobacteria bacterium]|nr:hypothetical protein FACS189472_10090 [Alphaproteobacteria bacterium]